MRTARYVDVDCDFYDSTLEAMEWMYRSELIVPGTLIGFDDWWTIPCATPEGAAWQPSETGEWRAFAEMARKYGVRLQCVGGACRMPPAGHWPYAWSRKTPKVHSPLKTSHEKIYIKKTPLRTPHTEFPMCV